MPVGRTPIIDLDNHLVDDLSSESKEKILGANAAKLLPLQVN